MWSIICLKFSFNTEVYTPPLIFTLGISQWLLKRGPIVRSKQLLMQFALYWYKMQSQCLHTIAGTSPCREDERIWTKPWHFSLWEALNQCISKKLAPLVFPAQKKSLSQKSWDQQWLQSHEEKQKMKAEIFLSSYPLVDKSHLYKLINTL